jgi:uncharacterized protein
MFFEWDPRKAAANFRKLGKSVRGRLLIVAHMDRGNSIRIISARKITKRERRTYEEER